MSKEQSAVIKGVAILLMLLYHLGCIDGIQGLSSLWGSTIARASHPISFFLIVSGYGLYYSYSKGRMNLQYLMKRIAKLYMAFWLVLFIFVFGIGSYFYPGRFSLPTAIHILNMIGWRWDYCLFTWFFLPYIFMMLSAKGVFIFIDKMNLIFSLICGFFLFAISSWAISHFYDSWLRFHYFIYHIVLWTNTLFCLIIGAIGAKLSLEKKKLTYHRLEGKNMIIVILLLVSFFIRGQINTHALNPFFAVLVIWLIIHLSLPPNVFKHVFIELGHKSMYMWLVQGFVAVVMFSEYFLLLRWPVLIWIIWVIICYIVSSLLCSVTDKLLKLLRLK